MLSSDESSSERLPSGRARAFTRLARLGVYVLAGGLLFACDAILGVDDDHPSPRRRNSGGAGPLAGEGGLSGSSDGESGAGATSGGSGESGRGTGSGGENTGGTDAGGSSGRGGGPTGGKSGRGGGGSGGDDGGAGAGGQGASGGGSVGPTLNEPCEVLGAHACAGLNDQLVLACEVAEEPHPNAGEQIWTISHTCGSEMRCDRTTAMCRDIGGACTNYVGPYCTSGGGLIDCEDNVFDGVHQCPFGCLDGACLLGTDNQLIVHTEHHPNSDSNTWPSDVPVCFVPGENTEGMQDVIRDEVESTWGRYGRVQFTGWDTCEDGATGVVIEFLEDCRARLGSQVALGYPGDGAASRVGFCRTYRDARGALKHMDQDEALTRFMARHQFGHVFGRVDDALEPTVMVRGIEHPGAETILLTPWDLAYFRMFYGGKYENTLVTTSGRCLAVVDSHIEPTRCTNEASQWWIPALDSVLSFADPVENLCVGITEEGAVDVTICSQRHEEVLWKMGHARWSLPGGCVAPRSYPPEPGDSLFVADCAPVGDETQSWYFEVFESVPSAGYATRIQLSDSGLCATLPGGVSAGGMVPVLEPCGELGQADQVFFLRGPGEIGFADASTHLCLTWDLLAYDIYLWTCGFNSRRNNFLVSGAIEGSNGLVLSVTPDDEDAVVGAVPPTSPLGRDQIFDWYY